MDLLSRCPLLWVVITFLLGGCSGSFWHSLRLFYTMIWEPEQAVSDFIAVGYLDDQLGLHYNSTTRRAVPRLPWLRKVEKEDPNFWDRNTQRLLRYEDTMKMRLMNLENLYNLSRGMHIWQRMFGCELSKYGHIRGFLQFGYNGEDYLSFDKDTLTWTAAVVPAQVTKRQWDAEKERSYLLKADLEEECIWWLRKLLDYGKESLLRREPPTVKVTRKLDYDGLETLICRAHGFHPKEIDATWRKDGEIWEQETFRRGVVPNSDGTYHTWLSVKIHPEDRDRYQCHVEHDSLLGPLDLAWEEPAGTTKGLSIGLIVGGVAVSCLFVAGIVFYICKKRRRKQRDYRAAREAPPAGDNAM